MQTVSFYCIYKNKFSMAYFHLKQQFQSTEGICLNLLQLFIYLNLFCLCQTIYPVHSLNTNTLRSSYPTVDDVTNTDDMWLLNDQNKKKTMDRLREFNRYLNSIFLRQQFYPEENEEPFDRRKFSVLSNQNKRDYLFLRG
ncbi:unnamed protein product [Schistosoma intercalatum]|nr:unnamed protein product [Schistosoma intercalatum]